MSEIVCNLVRAIDSTDIFLYICSNLIVYWPMTTTTIILLLAVAIVALVVIVAVLMWRNMRQADELRQKNDVIVHEVRRNQALVNR